MTGVREAIERYLARYPDGYDQDGFIRFSEHERCVIDRIAGNDRAQVAISAITRTDREIWELVELCSQAEWQMRTFHQSLIEKHETFEHLQRHRQKVGELRQFVAESFRIILNWPIPEAETGCQAALDHIDALIGLRQQAAKSDMLNRGVTRKSKAKSAAETAAIGWLAERVQKTFGKPFAQQVAVLAEVALGIGEVPEDRVRQALKARKRKRNDAEVVRSTQ
jgi:hypothetical protein